MFRNQVIILAICNSLISSSVYSLPSQLKVVQGVSEAVFIHPNEMEVRTGGQSVLHWEDFSIDSGEILRFVHEDPSGAILNRVYGPNISRIFGQMDANAKVYLVNSKGILIGPNGVLTAPSFVLSTLDAPNEQFFEKSDISFAGNSESSVVHLGRIEAKQGDLAILSYHIECNGDCIAKNGSVLIGAGENLILKEGGNDRILIKPATNRINKGSGISHSGLIEALQTEFKADGTIYDLAIEQSGSIFASKIEERGGKIYIVADHGKNKISGTLKAQGGEVHVLGETVSILENGLVDVSSDGDGGTVLVGGDFQGKNPNVENARSNYIDPDVVIDVSSKCSGNGGRVIVWSEEATGFFGQIDARGGPSGGDGGFVEISSHGVLQFSGFADRRAIHGKPGKLLLDPSDITVSANPNSNISFMGGVYTGSMANPSNILDSDLIMNWMAGDVEISTNSMLGGNGDLEFQADVFISTSHLLKLTVDRDLTLAAEIVNFGAGGTHITTGRNMNIGTQSAMLTSNMEFNGDSNIQIGGDLNLITSDNPMSIGSQLLLRGNNNINIVGNINQIGSMLNPSVENLISTGNSTIIVGGNINQSANGVAQCILAGFDLASNLNIFVGGSVFSSGGFLPSITGFALTGTSNLIIDGSLNLIDGAAIYGTPVSDITIVVDNQASSPPSIGTGGVHFGLNSGVLPAFPPDIPSVRIYTARFSQNSFDPTVLINNLPFTGLNRTQDSQNQYSTYFPAGVYTSPYTIYYKEEAIFPQDSSTRDAFFAQQTFLGPQLIAEMLSRLAEYPIDWIWNEGFSIQDESSQTDGRYFIHKERL